jgi:tRNA-2-methylthio-N6-dimethylallyladenosine synthase
MLSTYHLKTFGCQMNKHDSEKVAGLLQEHGMRPVETPQDADVVVFMTCCVREKADERLYGQVASLKALKMKENDGPIIAVGGCIGQRDGLKLVETMGHVDVVFGTHNLSHLPLLLDEAARTRNSQVEILDHATGEFAADLPGIAQTSYHAWLPITTGCDNFCSYCVVPYVRGREISRSFDDIVKQAHALIADGVKEITLLGQNVNSYGRDRYGEPRFAELLGAIAEQGISRLGFATSHPKDLCDDTIETMAAHANILDHLHLPMQSGSTAVLEAMNRRYTKQQYLDLVARIRAAMPTIALSTDIIVGFPGETDEDFADTLDVVKRAGFSSAFTFLYSKREGTPAATMEPQVPAAIAQERFDRLVKLIQEQAFSYSNGLVGETASVLLEGASKRDEQVLVGRDRHYRVVHLALPVDTTPRQWEGREVDVRITDAHTWYVSGEQIGEGLS